MGKFDYVIVGGGIVGLATAYALTRNQPKSRILLLEKERRLAAHQTGHNSGVIHSGVYYKPGSFKARFAREGSASMRAFAGEHGIAHEICGKVIVATKQSELESLRTLLNRGKQNGLDVQMLDGDELRSVEPCVSGVAAIRVPSAGIIDYTQVCETLARLVLAHGSRIEFGARVKGISQKTDFVEIDSDIGGFSAKMLINCAGLHSDRITRLDRVEADLKIIPFRGEYYELKPGARHLVRNLVYPVPNPAFPFLGVHFTRMIGGGIEAGPNAVLALAREGYRKTDFSLRDFSEVITFPGFWKLSARYWREGVAEMMRSLSKAAFVRSLQELVPSITADDLVEVPAGIRAQALKNDGTLVDDFHIVPGSRSIHVCNAPSPAATASLEIGKHIASHAFLA
ncbi:hydroxyglutarate oxidase [Paraburkholderia phytofirmans OLGA172]|uniref:Hydroxyglutarate oxidase n=1 Tax=Paraburkholderia phytofirmans OLGA172 TaxID=1417228 RepID=A0A160FSL7_9BURK|nr:L-2-hydroxyglutarate oxidase [Paraburkholderia phytofirmans]ANB75882.1 hydroxyglutarate oxidase [Paraburkholderia phytofirmans OLGA172]